MTHLLDTNTCVVHLRRVQASNISTKLAAAVPGSVVLSSVVVAPSQVAHLAAGARGVLWCAGNRFLSSHLSGPLGNRVAAA